MEMEGSLGSNEESERREIKNSESGGCLNHIEFILKGKIGTKKF